MEFKKSRLQFALLFVAFAWSAIAQAVISGHQIYALRRNAGVMPFYVDGDSLELRGAASDLRSMGLEPGDEVMALDGERITGLRQMEKRRSEMRPGKPVEMMVRRDVPGQAPKAVRVMVPVHAQRTQALHWIFTIVMYTLLPVFSLILGFWVAFSRPHDKLAWLTLAMLASFSQLAPGNFFGLDAPWMQIVVGYRSLLSNTWPLWVMLFGFYFPRPFTFLRKHRWVPYAVVLPFGVLLLVDFYTDFYDASRIGTLRTLAHYEKQLEDPLTIFFLLCIASFFVSIGRKFLQSKEPDARRRLQWLLVGSAVALTPPVLLEFLLNVLNLELPAWYITGSVLMVVLFPMTLAYVIVVQRAMQVRMAVRIGVQYAFARGGLTVARVVLTASVIVLCITLASRYTGPATTVVLIGLAIGLLSVMGRAGRRLTEWTDRKFFREAYDTEVILTELSQNVANIRETHSLLETVTRQISDSLHVPRVAVLLHSSAGFTPAYALGYGSLPDVELKADTTTVRQLREAKQPSRIYFDDESSWIQRSSDSEREALRRLDAQLMLPVAWKERLLGLISLGPKLSEEPYSNTDLRLLNAVASQTGLALENARLTETIRKEIVQRERFNRELEIAREVQERLFPQRLPGVAGLDYTAYCRPQQDVGGDYYDFVLSNESCFSIAIGDVSGKGIGAALMMASLQASLRSQILRPTGGPAEMLQLVNTLVYDASSSNRYATFFYAQYDPQTRALVYVNAGHNAPVVYRPGNGKDEILRLTEGGTVLGLFPQVQFQEGCVTLRRDDLLVAFTDGISEAMNSRHEEWDEDRLVETIRECRDRDAAYVQQQIVDRVDRFRAGARQNDDMTLVVARVL